METFLSVLFATLLSSAYLEKIALIAHLIYSHEKVQQISMSTFCKEQRLDSKHVNQEVSPSGDPCNHDRYSKDYGVGQHLALG